MTHVCCLMSSESENPTSAPQPTDKPRSFAADGGQARAESELWELEDEGNKASAASAKTPEPEDERRDSVRKWVAGPLDKSTVQKKENRKKTVVRLDIQPRGVARTAEQMSLPPRGVEQEFAKLDDWEEPSPSAVIGPDVTREVDAAPVEATGEVETIESEQTAISSDEPLQPREDQSHASSQTVVEDVPMKRVEWVGLAVLAVLVGSLLTGAYFWSIHLLPKETPQWKLVEYPVKGEHLEIKNATTYWRAPVAEGPDADPIRRGTRLIPVVELELVGGPAALRLIFRDEEGRGVGDPIIRFVPSSGKLALAATAGFEDPGMHAAYRTEQLEPWSVEVSEATQVDAPGSSFSKILKLNLSSDLR
jgi:hypothetical protein